MLRTVLTRLAGLVLVVPLAWLLGSPDAGSLDRDHRFEAAAERPGQNRTRQAASVGDGHYLADGAGGSYTREAHGPIGANLWLADLALWRRVTGGPPPTYADALASRRLWLAGAVAALVATGAPVWAVALSLALLAAFPVPASSPDGDRAWPSLVAVVGTLGALLRIAAEAGAWRRPLRSVGVLGGLGLGIGLAGAFRPEARGAPAATLAGVALLAALAGLLPPSPVAGWRARLRDVRRWPRALAGLQRRELRVALLAAAALAGIALAPLAVRANVALFELLEETEHAPPAHTPLVWHPLLLGLGSEFHSQENLEPSDLLGLVEMHLATGTFSGFHDPDYEAALRERFLGIAARNTPFVLQAWAQGLRELLLDDTRPLTTPLALAAALAIGAAVLRGAHRRPDGAVAIAGAAGLAAAFAVPPLLAGRALAAGFAPALAAATGLAAAAALRGSETPHAPQGPPAEPSGFGARALRAAAVAAAAGAVLLAAVAWWSIATQIERDALAEDLASGAAGYEDLLRAEPADAALAFNELPAARRAQLADAWLAERPWPSTVAPPSPDAAAPAVRAVWGVGWLGDTFLVFVRNEERLVRAVLSLDVELWMPAYLPVAAEGTLDPAPPFAAEREIDRVHRRIHLPDDVAPGTWLFGLHLPSRFVSAVSFDEWRLPIVVP